MKKNEAQSLIIGVIIKPFSVFNNWRRANRRLFITLYATLSLMMWGLFFFGLVYLISLADSSITYVRVLVPFLAALLISSFSWYLFSIEDKDSERFELRRRIEKVAASQNNTQKELHEFLTFQSMGLDNNLLKIHRYIPIRIFLSEEPSRVMQGEDIPRLFFGCLEAFGFHKADEFPPEIGSWFQRLFGRTKDALSHPELLERLKKIERAVDLQTLHKVQSDIDVNQANAVAALLKAIEGEFETIMQVGSVLLIRTTSADGIRKTWTRTMSQKEMVFLEQNQHLLKQPDDILNALRQNNRALSTHEDALANGRSNKSDSPEGEGCFEGKR